jgi:hypothetical protein
MPIEHLAKSEAVTVYIVTCPFDSVLQNRSMTTEMNSPHDRKWRSWECKCLHRQFSRVATNWVEGKKSFCFSWTDMLSSRPNMVSFDSKWPMQKCLFDFNWIETLTDWSHQNTVSIFNLYHTAKAMQLLFCGSRVECTAWLTPLGCGWNGFLFYGFICRVSLTKHRDCDQCVHSCGSPYWAYLYDPLTPISLFQC